jgi:hypothetical protein
MVSDLQRHSSTAHAAYHDLVSLLLDDAMADVKGVPTARQRNGRTYWYDRYRIGDEIQERYLGEDSPELKSRIDRYKALEEKRAGRKRDRGRLVRLLRGERFLGMDNATGGLIGALAKAGVFRLGGVLVGTNAFRLYEGELGIRLGFDQIAMTNDIDIASFEKLSLALGDTVSPSMEEVFADFDFSPVPSLDSGQVWRWRQSKRQTLVEFLTPSFSDDEGLRELPALGVTAQSLHFLNYLISDPVPAAGVYRDGILVHIPRPEKFAVHKLIVADRRSDGPDSTKARKDLLQAELMFSFLAEDRPTDLLEAYEDAMSRGPIWEERLARSMKRSQKAADLINSVK